MFFCKNTDYHPSRLLRAVQIFLLALIILGIGLIATKSVWVPVVVEYILKHDASYHVNELPILPPHASSTPVATSTVTQTSTTTPHSSKTNTAVLADGCFWCVEHDLRKVTGVSDVLSGYIGGTTDSPSYENYAEGGHREAVLVTYDASQVSYANLVEHIIKHGDPSDLGGSFHDRGAQYVPAIYYNDDSEKADAYRVIHAIDMLHVFPDPLPLLVLTRTKFWPAEEYHQDFASKNPLRYEYYRNASGRDAFITAHWGATADTFTVSNQTLAVAANSTGPTTSKEGTWNTFVKPTDDVLRSILTPLQYKVTQEKGTESPHDNLYDTNYDEGIYVDIVSAEPLYSSKDKFDSGTGWPSFVKPIADDAVVLKEDNTFFTKRTEVRSRYADSHIGHVFDDGPVDRGGKRYCMNSAAMRFIPKSDMEREGYGYLLNTL